MGGYSHERKHLIFTKERRKKGKKTDTWIIRNSEGYILGHVAYRPGWRRYVTKSYPNIDFDGKCHIQAAEFLDEQTAKLKATWKKRTL